MLAFIFRTTLIGAVLGATVGLAAGAAIALIEEEPGEIIPPDAAEGLDPTTTAHRVVPLGLRAAVAQ